jgi:hypothetical protein
MRVLSLMLVNDRKQKIGSGGLVAILALSISIEKHLSRKIASN